MSETTKTIQCPAAGRKDLICILGRIMQIVEGKPLMFWGTCPKCVKVTGGRRLWREAEGSK